MTHHPDRRSRAGDLADAANQPRSGWDLRMPAPPGFGLSDLRPELAVAALICLRYPEFDVARLRLNSNRYVLWRCNCGAVTRQKVCNVTRKGAVVCADCRPAGKSKWEFVVAELLRRMLETAVGTHYGHTRHDEVDLYMPAYGAAIELDPWHTHRDKSKQDRARLADKAGSYSRMTRIRDKRLEAIPDCPTVAPRAEVLEWAEAAAEWVLPGAWRELTATEVLEALRAGDAAWLRIQRTPPARPLSGYPDLVAEFVVNLDSPGRTPDWISYGSADRCQWRCRTAGHVYDAPVYHRTGTQQVGCRTCAQERAAASRRTPSLNSSAADLAPELVSEFVANLSRPGVTMAQMKPKSGDRCLWRCEQCTHNWVTTMKTRFNSTRGGCRSCCMRAAWRKRRIRAYGHLWEANQRARAAMEGFVAEHGDAVVPAGQTQNGFPLGEWAKVWRAKYNGSGPRGMIDDQTRAWLDSLPGWDPRPRANRWLATYRAVHALGRQGLPIDVALVGADPKLIHFVRKLRVQRRDGAVPPERVLLCEDIPGWTWNGPGRGHRCAR